MKLSAFVLWVAPLLLLSLTAADERPNVLLILVDDLKPSFGAYGDCWLHSPNLDRLAARGMRFDMGYCNQAVCAPSRNNLMTAARSSSLGAYSLGYHFRRAAPDAVTMPQYFKRRGSEKSRQVRKGRRSRSGSEIDSEMVSALPLRIKRAFLKAPGDYLHGPYSRHPNASAVGSIPHAG